MNTLLKEFENLKGARFIGIREYCSKTTGEVAHHVLNAGFSYGNAVQKDLTSLLNANEDDIKNIASTLFSIDLVKEAIEKLKTSLVNNQNEETASNQSKAQNEAYFQITSSIKLHKESMKIHIYALHVSKTVLVPGVYKEVKSRPLTLAQNAVKKYFDFSTAKYRQFIVDKEYLTSDVKINGNSYSL